MRNAARLILGFYPLPVHEARLLKAQLRFPAGEFSAVDPCVGDGVAFEALLGKLQCNRYGVELDTLRAEEAQSRGIAVIHGDALDARCPAESASLLYLNPPYDFEVGAYGNRRFEELFLEHTYRWLKRSGVLLFVVPCQQLKRCSRLLAEHFTAIRVYRLTSDACMQYNQVAVLAYRRSARQTQTDAQHRAVVEHLENLADNADDIPALNKRPDFRYEVPISKPLTLAYRGLALDELEDLLPKSIAYQQLARLLIRQPAILRGRPITQLHGGHVALLAASGALNGVFGEGQDRHIANWSPSRMLHHSVQAEDDGTVISRRWSSFSPKLLVLYEDGRTQILTHQKSNLQSSDDGLHELPVMVPSELTGSNPAIPELVGSIATENGSSEPISRRRTGRRKIRLQN